MGKIGQRIHWIDWAKAIGIIIVVLGHLKSPLCNWIFLFHMPLFFMLSGYMYKRVSVKAEIGRSVKSLLMPYFIYYAFFSILYIRDVSVSDVSNIILGNIEAILPSLGKTLWYLVALFVMRIFASFSKDVKWLSFSTLVLLGIFILLDQLKEIPLDCDYFQINTVLLCMCFFTIGNILKMFGVVDKIYVLPKRYVWPVFLIIGISVSCWGLLNGNVNVFRCQYGSSLPAFLIVSTSLSCIYFYIMRHLDLYGSPIIERISRGTLLILALHPPMQVLQYKFLHLIPDDMLSALLSTIVIIIVCYPLIILSEKYCPILIGKYRRK